MAQKLIHICDRCESYIAEGDAVTLSISFQHPGANWIFKHRNEAELTSFKLVLGKTGINRELCSTCSYALIDELKLGESNLDKKLFENFALPKLQDEIP